MHKDLSKLEAGDYNDVIEFLTNQKINEFINGIEGKKHPISDWMTEYISLPELGAHLVSKRMNGIYTHHGLYIGNKEVIHYAGLADGLKSAPVEKITISKFADGNKYKIIEHPHSKFTKEEIVERAYSRLDEDNYGLLGNNCEHFVNWCIYDINQSNQVSNVMKNIAPVKAPMAAWDIAKSIRAFTDGKISKEKLFDDIKRNAIPMSASSMYATFGGVIAGPAGLVVGGMVGYVVGNLLHESGLLAFGDSNVVIASKKRRERTEYICNQMTPLIRESRKNLEFYMEKYFSDRKEILEQSFNQMELSLNDKDNEGFLNALEKINNQYGKTLGTKTFQEKLLGNKAPW